MSRSLALDIPPPAQAADDMLEASIAGERVVLHAQRALSWPRERTLFVADVHLGKSTAFRSGGVPLPRGTTAADLGRLAALIRQSGAARLIILGDFLHARSGRSAALDEAFRAWRDLHARVDVTLVRGNHDAHAGDPPREWQVRCVDEPYPLPPFLGCHAPGAPKSGYALCGHLHPGVRLGGNAEPSAWLPCFVLGARRAILPAFGRFTGLASVDLGARDRIVAIAGQRLFALPPWHA